MEPLNFGIPTRPDADLAQALTIAYYGRPAHESLWEYWITELGATNSANGIVHELGNSSEYVESLRGVDNTPERLINELYQRMFDRDAGAEGLDYYSNRLSTGESTTASLPLDILNGADNSGDRFAVDNKINVASYFSSTATQLQSSYSEADISAMQALLQIVDESMESVRYAVSTAACMADYYQHGAYAEGDSPFPEGVVSCFDDIPSAYQPDAFLGYIPDLYDIDVL